jgi:hypothetical protein
MRNLFLAAACVIAVGVQAKAAPLVTVTTTDDIYGSFSGSIAQGATGADAMLNWSSAGSFWTGSIGLTENGIVVADIQTNADDIYVLYTLGSGDAAIGSPCTSTECVEITNNVQISL